MTREEMRQIREAKKAAKLAAKEEKKVERNEAKAWDKMVERLKAKGAWISNDEPESEDCIKN